MSAADRRSLPIGRPPGPKKKHPDPMWVQGVLDVPRHHIVGRTYHYANHDLVVAGDPLPVRLRRSRARNRYSAIGQPTF